MSDPRARPDASAPPTGLLGLGARSPGFELHDTPHSRVTLDDFAGRSVVLVFHVADWDPVATAQLTRLEVLRLHLDRLGTSVVGISADTVWSHAAFATAHAIGFPLLADDSPAGAVARAYGVGGTTSGRSRRALFVIDPDRVVRWSGVFPDMVDPGVDGMLAALEGIAVRGQPEPSPAPEADDAVDRSCPCGCGLSDALTSCGRRPGSRCPVTIVSRRAPRSRGSARPCRR